MAWLEYRSCLIAFNFSVLDLKSSALSLTSSAPEVPINVMPDCTLTVEDKDFYALVNKPIPSGSIK